MKKTIKLNETDLMRIVKRVVNEQQQSTSYGNLRPCKPGDNGTLVRQGNIFALSSGSPFCKVIVTQQSTSTTQTTTVKPAIGAAGGRTGSSSGGTGTAPSVKPRQ